MRKRNFLFNTLLVLGSTLIGFLIVAAVGEIYFRISFEADQTGPPKDGWYSFDAARGWTIVPGDYAYIEIAALRDVKVHVNQFGLRHPEMSLPIEANRRRITVLGDSFVFGEALNDDETITAQIQARAGPGYEVVPIAVPGYGTGQQILYLQELMMQGYEIGEHLVFVMFTNDIVDNVGIDASTLLRNEAQPIFSVDAGGELLHTAPTAPPGYGQADTEANSRALARESLFLRFLAYQGEVLAVAYPPVFALLERLGVVPEIPRRPGVITAWYDDSWDENWTVTEDILEWLATNFGRRPDVKLTFVFIPSPFQAAAAFQDTLARQRGDDPVIDAFLDDVDRPQRLLGQVAERLGVAFVDTTPVIRERTNRYPVYFPREGHLNELGTALVGDAIFDSTIGAAD